MTNESIREKLHDLCEEQTVVFDNPSFDNSIIGLTFDDRVVYDWNSMIYEFMRDTNCSYEDASEYISYNTLYAEHDIDYAPVIIMYDRNDIMEDWH